jgi:leader peptidase (prepilin peptidase)/N-methyltransferase
MLPVLAGVVGLVVGSFINVLIWRLPRGESVLYPPSHCPSCQHRLGARDLVPVLSWVLLRGRCRYCGSAVPVSYPLVEAVTGVIFAALVAVHGLHLRTAAYAVLATILITAAGTDMRSRLIPNRLTLPAIAFALTWSAAVRVPHLTSSLLGLAIAGGLFLVIAILSRGGMGGGDVKLAAAAGAFLGLQYSLLGLFLAFILGAVVGLVLMALGKKKRRDYIPFAPFIAAGCLAAMLFGDPILQWYLGIR